jgi:predicted nucleic acid-binding protein
MARDVKYTFDTNIITGYKHEELPKKFYMSAVVLSELMTAAVGKSEFDAYVATWESHNRDGTLIVPTVADWLMASKALYRIAQNRKAAAGGKAPRWPPAAKQEVTMDALLASCARRERVVVVTDDKDYVSIQHYCAGLVIMKGKEYFGK